MQSSLKNECPSVRWESSHKLHVTLKFLGDVLPQKLQQIQTLLLDNLCGMKQFPVTLSVVGSFPNTRSPRIIWIGSPGSDNSPLIECAEAVERLCTAAGLKSDERKFQPHITLGRGKGKIPDNLIKMIETITFEPIQFFCTELLVMKSNLSPSGSAYSQLFTIPLKY